MKCLNFWSLIIHCLVYWFIAWRINSLMNWSNCTPIPRGNSNLFGLQTSVGSMSIVSSKNSIFRFRWMGESHDFNRSSNPTMDSSWQAPSLMNLRKMQKGSKFGEKKSLGTGTKRGPRWGQVHIVMLPVLIVVIPTRVCRGSLGIRVRSFALLSISLAWIAIANSNAQKPFDCFDRRWWCMILYVLSKKEGVQIGMLETSWWH